jgi:hypothetical protein
MPSEKPPPRARPALRPLHALVEGIDDKFAAWSDEDKTKLEALEAELERDGPIAMERTMKKDPGFYMQLAVVLFPHKVREMLEDVWVSEGLTDADVRAKLERMRRERKH